MLREEKKFSYTKCSKPEKAEKEGKKILKSKERHATNRRVTDLNSYKSIKPTTSIITLRS